MKKLFISILALFALNSGPLFAANPLAPDAKLQGSRNEVLNGATLTIASGGTLTAASGSTINLSAVTLAAGSITVPTGKTLTVSAGGTLALSGVFGGTPTSGTLDLSAVTVIGGNHTIGASTAAAGSTNSDAAALPAGTARVYSTSGADGTKGVIISTSDKVTGRTIFVGNTVPGNALKVYPPAGGTINGGSANAAIISSNGKGVILTCVSSGSNSWLAW